MAAQIPEITTVYHPGAEFSLYKPAKIPNVPSLKDDDKYPYPEFNDTERAAMEADPLKMYFDHYPLEHHPSPSSTLTLTEPLTVGVRHRPAQVWRATTPAINKPLVARLYDPLYYDHDEANIFKLCCRAVAIENSVYARLQTLQGCKIPNFHGVFVAEIPGASKPRQVYVVLLEWIPGTDIQKLMQGEAGTKTCIRHKAAIIDAAARIFHLLYAGFGVVLDDSADRNTLIQLQTTPSTDEFCQDKNCPLRHLFYIGWGLPQGNNLPALTDHLPEASLTHQYTPRMFFIDLESARFRDLSSPRFRSPDYDYDLEKCRHRITIEWCTDWVYEVDDNTSDTWC
ncbi:hypothetical protein C8R43DRAFT_993937 [Mycena crocata]|nr:hypothetical protein C8R43DRAFT_993937 [Mycena crocata]